MKKSISKVLSLVLALAFVFSLAACGGAPSSAPAASGSAPASGSEPAAPADPTTLKVYTWWDVTKFEHLQKMQQDFEAANPDIKLEFVTIPSQYADTMVTKLAGGEIPDVMMLAMDQVPRYALNGMLMPLDDLASQLEAMARHGHPPPGVGTLLLAVVRVPSHLEHELARLSPEAVGALAHGERLVQGGQALLRDLT